MHYRDSFNFNRKRIMDDQVENDRLGKDLFALRHIGPNEDELEEMLKLIGADSLGSFMEEPVPSAIRLKKPLNLPEAVSEYRFLEDLSKIASRNKVFKSYIGLGYYDCITPSVIRRNIFENPGWDTQYTPNQAEVSQGRLEALLNFQTKVCDLTKMDVANASLLDEGTAAAEAMTMLARLKSRDSHDSANIFFVSEKCFPQTIDVLQPKADPLGIKLTIGDHKSFEFKDKVLGAIVQYPNGDGEVLDYSDFINNAHNAGALVAVASDLLSLTLLKPPGESGADVVVGSSQRFGVPLGYGGAPPAIFFTPDAFKRQVSGGNVRRTSEVH